MIKYCIKMNKYDGHGAYYSNIHDTIKQVSMCTPHYEPVYEVEISTVAAETGYYAQLDELGNMPMVHVSRAVIELCFPSWQHEFGDMPKGEVVNVCVKELRTVNRC